MRRPERLLLAGLAGLIAAATIVAAGLAAPSGAPRAAPGGAPFAAPAPVTPLHWRAVLVAGDGNLRVFDNATRRVAAWLRQRGVRSDDIARLSASETASPGVDLASHGHILHAIAALQAGPGDACFVYLTSHGIRGEGVALSADDSVLRPGELNRALAAGCGTAPTVAIVSACFSGSFAAVPMDQPNRVVITAARADRPSFGCSADQVYTFFDRCILSSLDRATTWQGLFDAARACVSARERRSDFRPSHPQAWFGRRVADLALPGPSR